MTTNPIVLGIDIGGTQIKACAFAQPNIILGEYITLSHADQNPKALETAVHEVIQHFKRKKIAFELIGIGCAGSIDTKLGLVRMSPNFHNCVNMPLGEKISSLTGLPTYLDNDANCALIAEYYCGKAKNKKNVILLTLGTGIGGAILFNGNIYRGSTGTAGELGHLSIHADGIPCPCGNTGCFERYCSASALKAKFPGVSPKEIFSKTSTIPVYREAVSSFLANLKVGLTSIANAFDPDLILLGGAVSGGVGEYLTEIRAWVKMHAFPAIGEQLQIELTDFNNLSGALGAGIMAKEEFLLTN